VEVVESVLTHPEWVRRPTPPRQAAIDDGPMLSDLIESRDESQDLSWRTRELGIELR
jgi:hypothetical protein